MHNYVMSGDVKVYEVPLLEIGQKVLLVYCYNCPLRNLRTTRRCRKLLTATHQ